MLVVTNIFLYTEFNQLIKCYSQAKKTLRTVNNNYTPILHFSRS